LVMADDLGWGDVGFNGNRVIRTPNLDAWAAAGVRLTRFYSAAPVCSPTRASCLTGRHPFRQGIYSANVGHLRPQEINLAEVLRRHGYATGHFGKWHLGTLTREVRDSNRGGPRGIEHYAPPWERGFETCFSTEAKVPTWDPMVKPAGKAPSQGWAALKPGDPREPYGTRYWTGPETPATENLDGDDSRIIMDRVVPFLERAVAADKPFFAVVWFHTPHLPVVAGPSYAAMYEAYDLYTRNYYGAITAMDEQVGRLRRTLQRLGVERRTLVFFCSDNGPEGRAGKAPGSAGPYRGRKRSLYEGGVRVPAFVAWPDRLPAGRTIDVPCVTSDYLPTILEAVGLRVPELASRPMDGLSLWPILEGRVTERGRPIGFQHGAQRSLTGDRWKLYTPDKGRNWELYDLKADPAESRNVAAEHPDVVRRLRSVLEEWVASCKASDEGRDY
ncbi:MAG: N-acetylgalactosamine 6-sulfate sulfatase, partial [Verrucomicrobia bacterium]